MIEAYIADLTGGDDARAERAAVELGRLSANQQAKTLETMKAILKTADADQRWWIARAISENTQKESGLILISLLQDHEPSVRQCAALALSQRPTAAAIPLLIDMLSETDPLTGRLAGEALSVLGAQAVSPLLECLERGSPIARSNAVRSLAEIGDLSAAPALITALDDPSIFVNHWANEGLERMGVGMAFFQP